MTPEQVKLLHEQLGTDRTRSLLIEESLTGYFADHPIENEHLEIDLNPHLYVKFVAANVATDVEHQGIECSDTDVLLMWLTDAVLDGKFTSRSRELPPRPLPAPSPRCPKCNGWIDNTLAADNTMNCANCKHRWVPSITSVEQSRVGGVTETVFHLSDETQKQLTTNAEIPGVSDDKR